MDDIIGTIATDGTLRKFDTHKYIEKMINFKEMGDHRLLWMDGEEKACLVCFDCSFYFSFSTASLPANEERLFRKWGYGKAINKSCDGDDPRIEVTTSTDERRMNVEMDIIHPVEEVDCTVTVSQRDWMKDHSVS